MRKKVLLFAFSVISLVANAQSVVFSETMASDPEGWYSGNVANITVDVAANPAADEVNDSEQVIVIDRTKESGDYIFFRDKSWLLDAGAGENQYKYLHFDILATADCGNIRLTVEDNTNTMKGYKDVTLAGLGAEADGAWHHVTYYMGDAKNFQGEALNSDKIWRFGFRPTKVGMIYLDNVKFTVTESETTTGVKYENESESEKTIYNLQGQRVSAAHKGIVIKNGHKYIIK